MGIISSYFYNISIEDYRSRGKGDKPSGFSGDFVGYSGNWYLIDPSTGKAAVQSNGNAILIFTVVDPSLDIKIWDMDSSTDVTGKSVPQGERLSFRVDTNMYAAFDPLSRPDITGSTAEPST